MLEPKVIQIGDREYTISKIPAFQAQQILMFDTASVLSSIIFPKFGADTKQAAASYCLEIMRHVYVDIGGNKVALNSKALIDNHVAGLSELLQLQAEVVSHTINFSSTDMISSFLRDFAQVVKSKASEALTTS